MPASATESTATDSRLRTGGQRFVRNVLWNWGHVLFSLLAAVLLSPYIIRKLGAEGYGVWSLVNSILGYYTLLDLGFRSAVVRFSAHYRARGEYGRVNELMNTLVVSLAGPAVVAVLITVPLSRWSGQFFQISPAYRPTFSVLVLLVGLSVSLGIVFNLFSGLLEGFQRFDLDNQGRILCFVIRYVGAAAALALGYGLVTMGILALAGSIALFVWCVLAARRMFPALRFSRAGVNLEMLKETARFGASTLLAAIAIQVLDQAPAIVIGHYLPVAFVGYYALPVRLLQSLTEFVGRVGIVASPRAAELAAKGRMDEVARLSVCVNRYCLGIYAIPAIVLLVYGREILTLWVGAEFASHCAPILPILLLGTAFAQAGQFASSAILFGLARHHRYAQGLAVEAVIGFLGILAAVPRFGIAGAAAAIFGAMFVIRGLSTPWLFCRYLKLEYGKYMRSILWRPVLTGLPVLLLLYGLKTWVWAGGSWLQLLVVAALTATTYLGLAYFSCLEPAHRVWLAEWVGRRWRRGEEAWQSRRRN